MSTEDTPRDINATMAARERLAETAAETGVRMEPHMQLFFAYSAPCILNAISALLTTAHKNGQKRSKHRRRQRD